MTAIIVCSSWWTYWFIGCFTSCYILGGLLVWGRLRWVGRASDFPQWPLTQRWNFGPPPELQTPTDRFYGGRPWASCVCDVTVSSTLHRPNPGEYSSSSSAPPHTPLSLFLSLSVFLSVSLSLLLVELWALAEWLRERRPRPWVLHHWPVSTNIHRSISGEFSTFVSED